MNRRCLVCGRLERSSTSTVDCSMNYSQRTTGSGEIWYKSEWRRSLEMPLKRTLTGCSMSAAAATQGCGTLRELYSPDTESLPPAITISQSNPLPRCPVGWQSRQMRGNHSSPSSDGGWLENKDVSRLLCSEHDAFLVSPEAFTHSNTSTLMQRGG